LKTLTLFALVTCSALLVGCASVPMTSASLDSDAKKFQPEPGKASIYLNRKGTFAGDDEIIQIVLDGRIVGALAPGTYELLSVAPGEHVLMNSGPYENVVQAKINAEQGNNYFFDVGLTKGWSLLHVSLKQIGDAEGQKEVKASKRADAVTY
jgi:hypothetical protein